MKGIVVILLIIKIMLIFSFVILATNVHPSGKLEKVIIDENYVFVGTITNILCGSKNGILVEIDKEYILLILRRYVFLPHMKIGQKLYYSNHGNVYYWE